MPIYDFKCEKCEHQFSEKKTIANRDVPLSEPCPECGLVGCVVKEYLGAPAQMLDTKYRVDSKHNMGGFRDAMERMSERPGIKGTPDGDRIKAKYCT